MPRVLDILKNRWPEVMLIVLVGLVQFYWLMLAQTVLPDGRLLLLLAKGGVWLILIALGTTINLGFLRTACLLGETRWHLPGLIETGYKFFWRICGFAGLFIIALSVITWGIFQIVRLFVFQNNTFLGGDSPAPEWVRFACFFIGGVVLVKPFLLVPALIIARDCRMFTAFKYFKQIKICRAKSVLPLFFIFQALPFLLLTLPAFSLAVQYILVGLFSGAGTLLAVALSLSVIRYVSLLSLKGDYELNEPPPLL
ncbi:MAG: hypothetical protein KAJ52_07820 [Sedimentisphaerales bacterium]|nr:hypothetical protein [Sedimentisphaerales bacterium]